MADSCGDCRFWRQLTPQVGACHRFPPGHYGWLETGSAKWCGEHQPVGEPLQNYAAFLREQRENALRDNKLAEDRERERLAGIFTTPRQPDHELVWSTQPPTQPGVYRCRAVGAEVPGAIYSVERTSHGDLGVLLDNTWYPVDSPNREWSQRLAPVSPTAPRGESGCPG